MLLLSELSSWYIYLDCTLNTFVINNTKCYKSTVNPAVPCIDIFGVMMIDVNEILYELCVLMPED